MTSAKRRRPRRELSVLLSVILLSQLFSYRYFFVLDLNQYAVSYGIKRVEDQRRIAWTGRTEAWHPRFHPRFAPVSKDGSVSTWVLPNTTFTPYISTLVDFFRGNRHHCLHVYRRQKKNGPQVNVTVSSPSAEPIFTSTGNWPTDYDEIWKRLFRTGTGRFLPAGSLELVFSRSDMDEATNRCYFANSSPGGHHTVFNFQDVRRWLNNETLASLREDKRRISRAKAAKLACPPDAAPAPAPRLLQEDQEKPRAKTAKRAKSLIDIKRRNENKIYTATLTRERQEAQLWHDHTHIKERKEVAKCQNESKIYLAPLPWNEREAIPVFRGRLWYSHKHVQKAQEDHKRHLRDGMSVAAAGDAFFAIITGGDGHHQRLQLVYFSKLHPELLNARLSPKKYGKNHMEDSLLRANATNGMHRLLPFDKMPAAEYYARYQTHVIMGGAGAAFRTARVLEQGSTVILQDYPWEEWFTSLMVPYVHYIPLRRNLSNLHDVLLWVRDHPSEVLTIARNGRRFYEEYLSYERMGEFYYELLFRLMLCCGSDSQRQK